MSNVIADISISVDGFVTGPGAGPGAGLGEGGEAIHGWVGSDAEADQEALDRAAQAAAVVMGRRLFDVVDAPDGWGEGTGYGADRDTRPPLVVLTSEPPSAPRLAARYDLSFVTEGPAAAVARAREVAGGGDVYVMGGAAAIVACLAAGAVDRLRLHVSPVVLGAGTPLFSGGTSLALRQAEVSVSPVATHVTYDVLR